MLLNCNEYYEYKELVIQKVIKWFFLTSILMNRIKILRFIDILFKRIKQFSSSNKYSIID